MLATRIVYQSKEVYDEHHLIHVWEHVQLTDLIFLDRQCHSHNATVLQHGMDTGDKYSRLDADKHNETNTSPCVAYIDNSHRIYSVETIR